MIPKTIDDVLPNEIPYLGDEAPQEEGEELMAVEETLEHKITTEEEDENAPESVENVKKGLQDYIKSMFRRK